LIKRAITGFFFVAALVLPVYYSAFGTFFIFLLVTLLGLDEFYSLTKKNKVIQPQHFFGLLIGLITFVLLALYFQHTISIKYFALFIPLFLTMGLTELYRKKENPFINIAYTVFGILYIAVASGLIIGIGYLKGKYQFELILSLFFFIWANDTFAYLTGKYFGKHKLFERISPKKTWEGLIGGAVFTLLTAWIVSLYFKELTLQQWIIYALICVVFGAFGDLFESMLKRSLHVKDSGNILPGHGGILDRFDAMLFAAPFIYAYLLLFT
jgi:phosphatidate cytidylyltransferase